MKYLKKKSQDKNAVVLVQANPEKRKRKQKMMMRRFKGDYLGNRNLKMNKWMKMLKTK